MSGVQEEKGGREKRVCKDQGPLFWLPEIRSPASSCRFRLTCEECGKPHPTLFHNSVQTAKRPQRNSKPLTLKPRTSRSPPHMLPLLQATSQRARMIVCVAQQVYLTLGPPPL